MSNHRQAKAEKMRGATDITGLVVTLTLLAMCGIPSSVQQPDYERREDVLGQQLVCNHKLRLNPV